MNNPFQKLKNTLVYTAIETLCYQSTLALYQIYLYYELGAQQYGIIGAFFSLIYVGAQYANMGLDITLAPMLHEYKTRAEYIRSVIYQIAIQIILGLLLVILLIKINFTTTYASQKQLVLCCLIAISESTKKTLKTVLHLVGLHFPIACVEIGYIASYMSSIGLLVLSGWKLSFWIIMMPIFLCNLLSIGLYSFIVYSYWIDLPDQNNPLNKAIVRKQTILRIKSWIYQIVRSFYSTNFLIFLIAAYYNLETAGIIKLISSLYNAISSMLRYILGTSSSVLFSHIKQNFHATDLALKTLQGYTYILGIGITCSIGLATSIIVVTSTSTLLTQEYYVFCILLIALLLSEQLSIMYESLLLVQEKMVFLIICYAVTIPLIMYAKYRFPDMVIYLYFSIISLRCLYFFIVYYYTHYILTRTKNDFKLGLFSQR
jgi:hypothetical protein